jgi:hypothetical protein
MEWKISFEKTTSERPVSVELFERVLEMERLVADAMNEAWQIETISTCRVLSFLFDLVLKPVDCS